MSLMTFNLNKSPGQSWGIRLHGGKDFAAPLCIQKVNSGSVAERCGIQAGDVIVSLAGKDGLNLRHKEAQDVIMHAGNAFELIVQRGSQIWKPSVTPLAEPNLSSGFPVATKTSLAANPKSFKPRRNISNNFNSLPRCFSTKMTNSDSPINPSSSNNYSQKRNRISIERSSSPFSTIKNGLKTDHFESDPISVNNGVDFRYLNEDKSTLSDCYDDKYPKCDLDCLQESEITVKSRPESRSSEILDNMDDARNFLKSTIDTVSKNGPRSCNYNNFSRFDEKANFDVSGSYSSLNELEQFHTSQKSENYRENKTNHSNKKKSLENYLKKLALNNTNSSYSSCYPKESSKFSSYIESLPTSSKTSGFREFYRSTESFPTNGSPILSRGSTESLPIGTNIKISPYTASAGTFPRKSKIFQSSGSTTTLPQNWKSLNSALNFSPKPFKKIFPDLEAKFFSKEISEGSLCSLKNSEKKFEPNLKTLKRNQILAESDENLVPTSYNSPINLYNDDLIAQTLSAHAEVIDKDKGVMGVNFMKNEKAYDGDASDVLQMVREMDRQPSRGLSRTPNRDVSGFPLESTVQSHSFNILQRSLGDDECKVEKQRTGFQNLHSNGVSTEAYAQDNFCMVCASSITGVFVRVKNKHLHAECFKCSTCGCSLKNAGYYNINDKLYCDIHAKQAARSNPPGPNLEPVTVPPGKPVPPGAFMSAPSYQPQNYHQHSNGHPASYGSSDIGRTTPSGPTPFSSSPPNELQEKEFEILEKTLKNSLLQSENDVEVESLSIKMEKTREFEEVQPGSINIPVQHFSSSPTPPAASKPILPTSPFTTMPKSTSQVPAPFSPGSQGFGAMGDHGRTFKPVLKSGTPFVWPPNKSGDESETDELLGPVPSTPAWAPAGEAPSVKKPKKWCGPLPKLPPLLPTPPPPKDYPGSFYVETTTEITDSSSSHPKVRKIPNLMKSSRFPNIAPGVLSYQYLDPIDKALLKNGLPESDGTKSANVTNGVSSFKSDHTTNEQSMQSMTKQSSYSFSEQKEMSSNQYTTGNLPAELTGNTTFNPAPAANPGFPSSLGDATSNFNSPGIGVPGYQPSGIPKPTGPPMGGADSSRGVRQAPGLTSTPRRGKGIMNQASVSRIPMCSSCQRQIRGPFVSALGKSWCPDHFVCATPTCRRQILEMGFVEEKDSLYCEVCYENYLAPICGKCNKRIKGDCLNAIGKQFHPDCFCCAYCGKIFGAGSFFLEDGLPYCETDWNDLFTTKCVGCNFPIEAGDRWVEALNNNYHSQCFKCMKCHKNLEGQSFFAKGGKPFCKAHAQRG